MHDATLAACANIVGPVMAEGRQPVAEARALHRRRGVLSDLRDARRPPHRARRAGAEVHPQSACTRSSAPTSIPLCLRGPGPASAAGDRFPGRRRSARCPPMRLRRSSPASMSASGALNTLPEAFEDANVTARGMVLRDDLGRRHIAPVIRFRDEPPSPTCTRRRSASTPTRCSPPCGPPSPTPPKTGHGITAVVMARP